MPPPRLSRTVVTPKRATRPIRAASLLTATKPTARNTSPLHRRPPTSHPFPLRNLPTPAHPPKESSPTDPSHGLWSFFPPPRTLPLTPETLQQHGGAWSAALLRPKSWSDLHSLYWVCVRERNMLYTSEGERERLIKGEGYGKYEFEVRVSQVEKTMERIRGVLRERYYAWQEGRGEAMRDDEVDLYAAAEGGVGYVPGGRTKGGEGENAGGERGMLMGGKGS